MQAALRGLPLFKRLEFDGLGGEVRHVQLDQDVFGGFGVVIGRTPDERKTAQRHQRINRRHAVLHKEAFDSRALIKPGGKGGNYFQSSRF